MASAKKATKGRGAKAPRSAFRGTAKAKPPAGAKPAKAKAKVPKAKPRARAPRAAEPRSMAEIAETTTTLAPVAHLGSVTCPSGMLGIFDVGLAGYLPREALEPAIVKVAVPRDRPLVVTGTRVGRGRFRDAWDFVAIELGDGEITGSRKLGEAGVDFARLVLMDIAALEHWVHDESLDGKADVVFWGRDEGMLAKVMVANRLADGSHGWMDLSLADAELKADDAARRKASNKWLLNIDYRPHSHHYQALAAARSSAHGAGTLEVGGARLVLFFTTWGDGVFPVYLDVDAAERPVRVRIQLATAASTSAMQQVNA